MVCVGKALEGVAVKLEKKLLSSRSILNGDLAYACDGITLRMLD